MNLLEKAKLMQQHEMQFGARTRLPQRVLLYGDTGTGKTTLAALLGKKYRLHIFDIDKGSSVIENCLPMEYWGNVNVYGIEDVPENARAAKLLDKVLRPRTKTTFCEEHGEIGCALCKGKPQATFDTTPLGLDDVVIVDSGTAHSRSVMNFALGTALMQGDMAYLKPEYSHYDKQGVILGRFLQWMKRLPCHFILITHAEVTENLNGTKTTTPILGTRKFARTLGRDFDHTVYCYLKNNKHCFTSSTTHSANVFAGSRANIDVRSTEDFFKLFEVSVCDDTAAKILNNPVFEQDDTGGPDENQEHTPAAQEAVEVQENVVAPTKTVEVAKEEVVPKAITSSNLSAALAKLKPKTF